jgi:hypothetical protein
LHESSKRLCGVLSTFRESEITLQETEDGNPMCGKGELQLQHAFGGFGGMEQGIRNCR